MYSPILNSVLALLALSTLSPAKKLILDTDIFADVE